LELDPRFSLISGPNASGKTSVLEALYVLGRGRSFRTPRLEYLIRQGTERFMVFGEAEGPNRRVPMGVEGGVQGVRARIAGAPAGSLAELAVLLPVQIIDPEVHRLIEEGPNRRRRFLDWGTFHVKQSFVADWQRFQQVLRQRNASLKARQPRALVSAWDPELVHYGELVSQARSDYLAMLIAPAQEAARALLGLEVQLVYRPGWAKDRSFAEALDQAWGLDLERGVTQVGPQRADLSVRLDGAAVKDRISRGQQKLLAAALLLAQLKLFPEAAVRPTLLLDDPAAELDREHLAALIDLVAGQSLQLVVTTLHDELPGFGHPGRRFAVELGSVAACD
jgi:DNA replication and repair protein RecF